MLYPIDFLNSFTLPDLPSYALDLKINNAVILLIFQQLKTAT